MACSSSQAACFSGRAPATSFVSSSSRTSRRGGAARRRDLCATRSIRSSLEEEFKKQVLGLTSGSNSSSNSSQERRKDLSAHGSRMGSELTGGNLGSNLGGGGAAASSSPPDSSNLEETSAPFAANLPLSEPYHPLEFYPTSHIDLDWGSSLNPDEPWVGGAHSPDRSRCFVILFGVGRAETEGIYSLRALAKEDGLPVDTIVAFENEDDALRYSTLLEATMDHEPTVWPIEWGELLEFCNSAGYRCRLEPAGSLLIPPDYNVGMTDWEKSLKLRKGEFSVLGAEPEPATAASPLPATPAGLLPDWFYEPSFYDFKDEEELKADQLNAVIDTQLSSPAALEAMKAALERLLPQD